MSSNINVLLAHIFIAKTFGFLHKKNTFCCCFFLMNIRIKNLFNILILHNCQPVPGSFMINVIKLDTQL